MEKADDEKKNITNFKGSMVMFGMNHDHHFSSFPSVLLETDSLAILASKFDSIHSLESLPLPIVEPTLDV